MRLTTESKFSFERHPLLMESYRKQSAISSSTDFTKQSRINSLKHRMDEIADALSLKRTQTVKERFRRMCVYLETKFRAVKTEVFGVFHTELCVQSPQDLLSGRRDANYSTRLSYRKRQLTAKLCRGEQLLSRQLQREWFQRLRANVVMGKLQSSQRRRMLSAVLQHVRQAAAVSKQHQTREKVFAMLVKLDTFVLLLKYNSFFALMAAGV
jgi:hypothetical protein